MRILFFLVFWLVFGVGLSHAEKLAVLEFYGVGVDKAYLELLTDSARGGALDVGRGEGIEIYTQENMLMMLSDMGKSAECMEGSCEVEIARNISADYVVSGKVTKRGSTIILQMKFHESRGGTLLATEELTDTDELALQQSVKPKTGSMIRKGLSLSMDTTIVVSSVDVVEAKVEGLSGDLATRMAQLEGQRLAMEEAEKARLAEEERQRLERKRLEQERQTELARQRLELEKIETELERVKQEAQRPYQEKAKTDWAKVKVFAEKGDDLGKEALAAFISEYSNVRVSISGQSFSVVIPEVAEAEKILRMAQHDAFDTVVVSGGTFKMGCLPSDRDCSPSEYLRHRVTISHTLVVMTTEVTQGLYESVMNKNPSKFSSCGKDCPVEQVSWYDAVAFANALSRQEDLSECYRISGTDVTWLNKDCSGWRLPTEAEWEYLARGDEGYKYAGSNSIDDVAWYSGNSRYKTHPVGQKQANGFGLYDMTGNIYEWTWDWYTSMYDSKRSVTDPRGPSSGSYRVNRGGGCRSNEKSARVSNRTNNGPASIRDTLGIRLIRNKI